MPMQPVEVRPSPVRPVQMDVQVVPNDNDSFVRVAASYLFHKRENVGFLPMNGTLGRRFAEYEYEYWRAEGRAF